jgi:hypothetical protein
VSSHNGHSTMVTSTQVNILITVEHWACLADFGLATARDSQAILKASASTSIHKRNFQPSGGSLPN